MKKQTTYSFKTLGGGRNALVVWVLAVCAKLYRHPELVWLLLPTSLRVVQNAWFSTGSINIKFERLLTRIRSCTTLFCYAKNLSPPNSKYSLPRQGGLGWVDNRLTS